MTQTLFDPLVHSQRAFENVWRVAVPDLVTFFTSANTGCLACDGRRNHVSVSHFRITDVSASYAFVQCKRCGRIVSRVEFETR